MGNVYVQYAHLHLARWEEYHAEWAALWDAINTLAANGFEDQFCDFQSTTRGGLELGMQPHTPEVARTIRKLLGASGTKKDAGSRKIGYRFVTDKGLKVHQYGVDVVCTPITKDVLVPAKPAETVPEEVVPAEPEHIETRTIGYLCDGSTRPHKRDGTPFTDEEVAALEGESNG